MARFFAISRAQGGTALDYDNLTTSAAVSATLTTSLTGANNDITWTADTAGIAGNNISIEYVDPGTALAALSVVVTGDNITVSLATNASALITSTATQVYTLVNADLDAGPMVTGAAAPSNSGAGVVTAMAATFLSGGDDADVTIPAVATGDFTGSPPNVFAWPVTGGNIDRNVERIDRNAEVRYGRVPTPPLPFRANPTATVPVPAYLDIIRQVIPKVMGSTETTTTPAPGITSGVTQHSYIVPTSTVDWQVSENHLPWFYTYILRENLFDRMAGTYINRVTFNFPLDGEGTMEVEFFGLYMRHYDAPTGVTVSYLDTLNDVLMLRDARAYINNAPSQVSDIQGISITFNNNVTPKWYAGRNRTSKHFYDPDGASGNADQQRKLWWPAEQRLTGQLDITYSLTFGSTTAAQEISIDFTQIQKFQFDIFGSVISGANPSTTEELLRFTIPGGAATGGGAGDLVAREDILTTLDGTANDLLVDIWDGDTDPLYNDW